MPTHCFLINLKSKALLAKRLNLPLQVLQQIRANPFAYYKMFSRETSSLNKAGVVVLKKRPIQTPRKELRHIHNVLKSAFSFLPKVNYLKHVRGEGYIKHGSAHATGKHLLIMDIKKFFPSCTREYIFRFFLYELNTSPDVAWLLADLCTIPFLPGNEVRILPTGSPISQSLSYWSHAKCFDDIQNEAIKRNILFTLYVDDMAFSAQEPIPVDFEEFVIRRIGVEQLQINRRKTKRFHPNLAKRIAGIHIDLDGKPQAPLKLKKKLFTILKMRKRQVRLLTLHETRRATGLLSAIRAIEVGRYPVLWERLKNQLHLHAQQQAQEKLLNQPSSSDPQRLN